MPIITLLTDFGFQDEYVGVMKGVIHSVFPEATILDITHCIDPQDITQAAYVLNTSYSYFPKDAIHVIVVDPGVGSDRKIIALKHREYTFLAPDNGVMNLVMATGLVEAAYHVNNASFFLETVSNTFHGRDIFAPVAAHLAKGLPLGTVGTPISSSSLFIADIPKPSIIRENEIVGSIISVDRFGNLMSNIDTELLDVLRGLRKNACFIITIGGCEISGISKTYNSVAPGEPMGIIGSRGLLEISVFMGDAEHYLNCRKGDQIRISIK